MPEVLEKLKQGIRHFQSDAYQKNAEKYRIAGTTAQKPHTLVITCADSRIGMENITSSGPGELFIMRNVGNLVPEYGDMLGGVSAVIEYAVSALKVQHAVICGHSDCGAMKALRAPESLDALPTVKLWLTNAEAAKKEWSSEKVEGEESLTSLARLTETNVLHQLGNLKTHPSVVAAMERGELTVSGWVYDIGTGEIRIAEDGQTTFTPVSGGANA